MTKASTANPNGFCAYTCGRCNCTVAATPVTQNTALSGVPQSPALAGATPGASPNSPEAGSSSPEAAASSPVATGTSPAVTAMAPPQPLSAAFAANCDCTDVPPDGTTCAAVVSLIHHPVVFARETVAAVIYMSIAMKQPCMSCMQLLDGLVTTTSFACHREHAAVPRTMSCQACRQDSRCNSCIYASTHERSRDQS